MPLCFLFVEYCYDCNVSIEFWIRLGQNGRWAKGLRCLAAFHVTGCGTSCHERHQDHEKNMLRLLQITAAGALMFRAQCLTIVACLVFQTALCFVDLTL
mmetsp:Transcript_135256/g.269841  ORF Transcript_135256/g.269841 Transcript_135256/m.269841 type:complete len:99 (-) Transcript_135256:269-565(-)